MAKKNKKDEYVDDGHTIYNMDIEGFKWHDKKVKNQNGLNLSFKERMMLIFAAYKSYLPTLLIMIVGFTLAILLICLWLN